MEGHANRIKMLKREMFGRAGFQLLRKRVLLTPVLSVSDATILAKLRKEISMGTWDVGPFDNDTAADFAGDLDEAALDERESVIRGALKRAANPADYLDAPDAERAVAAAALVVAQHPAGQPACPNYGPSEPLPEFPADLRTLAVDALDHVVAEPSELAELWGEAPDGPKWRQDITRLRHVLDPPLPPQEEGLFDV